MDKEIAIWRKLRERTLDGEKLNRQEASIYAAITERLDRQEAAALDAAYVRTAREARERVAASEAELARLRLRREELTARARELESVLDEPAAML